MRPHPYAEKTPDVADLVSSHTNLVRKIAWHYKGRVGDFTEIEDLIQAGFIGLIDASQRYRPHEGVTFIAYAAIRVRGAIVDHLRQSSNLSRGAIGRQKLVKFAREKLQRRFGRSPDPSEIQTELGITASKHENWLEEFEANNTQSLDQVYSDHSILFSSNEDNPEEVLVGAQLKDELREALTKLPEREATVLQLYYVEELNLHEIGAVFGVTVGRISQIKLSAVQKLRALMDDGAEAVTSPQGKVPSV